MVECFDVEGRIGHLVGADYVAQMPRAQSTELAAQQLLPFRTERRWIEHSALHVWRGLTLLGVGMRLSKVELDARGAWQLTLGNGVTVRLGRQDVPARLERFIAVASPVVAARAAEVSYVDLRYSNGFSVGWNAPARVARDAEEPRSDG